MSKTKRLKTLVKAVHEGRHRNGVGGCCTRWANDGRCQGEQVAAWLNGLGADDEPYTVIDGITQTVGDLRRNWLRGNEHIMEAK